MLEKVSTIYALSSPPGRGGVAVIRVSGPCVPYVVQMVTEKPWKDFVARHAYLLYLYAHDAHASHHDLIYDGEHICTNPQEMSREEQEECAQKTYCHRPLDRGLVITFPAPHSFTGENMVEFHTHTSPYILNTLFRSLSRIPNVRIAKAGEFSRRAFENNKLSLSEVEGLVNLIDAQTERQHQQAMYCVRGDMQQVYEKWRESFVAIASRIESLIDFFDDENDIDQIIKTTRDDINKLIKIWSLHLNNKKINERIRCGVTVILLGNTNAGKSSLFNRMAHEERAIVSPYPGTTRDLVEIKINVGGFLVKVLDTAGLESISGTEPQHILEREGQRKAQEAAECADVRIVVQAWNNLEDIGTAQHLPVTKGDIALVNKIDLAPSSYTPQAIGQTHYGEWTRSIPMPLCCVSAKTGQGMEGLLTLLQKTIERHTLQGKEMHEPYLMHAYHYDSLSACVYHLKQALRLLNCAHIDLAAEEVRLCADNLGKITGSIVTDDLLEKIFSDFCIGK